MSLGAQQLFRYFGCDKIHSAGIDIGKSKDARAVGAS
jgi:hypothetical protein